MMVSPDPVADAFLGITHQRISQLCKIHMCHVLGREIADDHQKDMPTWSQVTALERWTGQAIITGALAQRATTERGAADPIKEAGDVIVNASKVFDMVRENADPKAIRAAIIEHRREVDELDQSLDGAA